MFQTVTGNPEKLYAGYQLPLILSNVNSLLTYRVAATLDMKFWWEKIPWATDYRVYTNGTDPFGLYIVLGATSGTECVDSGVIGVSSKQFYRVKSLRPWITP